MGEKANIKVDLNRLRELKHQLAIMERKMEELVIRAASESSRVAQHTKGCYRGHDVAVDCDEVLSMSKDLRRQGERLSEMLRAKIKGLERAIELYQEAERPRKVVKRFTNSWSNGTFARMFKFNWTTDFPQLARWLDSTTSYGAHGRMKIEARGLSQCNDGVSTIGFLEGKREFKCLTINAANPKVSKSSISSTNLYNNILPCYQAVEDNGWTTDALNHGWGPISKGEYEQRISRIVAKSNIDNSIAKVCRRALCTPDAIIGTIAAVGETSVLSLNVLDDSRVYRIKVVNGRSGLWARQQMTVNSKYYGGIANKFAIAGKVGGYIIPIGMDFVDNARHKAKLSEYIADCSVDIAVTYGTIAASGAIGTKIGTTVGTIGGPAGMLIGAGTGLVLGTAVGIAIEGISIGTDSNGDNITIKKWAQEKVKEGIDYVLE